ncbi:bifunctional UDP-N-acetylglucosamine pyrophosphorylase GlmU [Gottschalkia acidurici 9a]|uniref:Bifunctional protein GlmU n=1 Tax=Gottschalkia acidurici (strain ATCC 7906 / DSM 604 / BCRC 14475 / CIP 104303 / KCTC 5404 / NCIMB 10678 / 9a) TaxID=1128398 RepID=K0B4C0_GOTA9|nr:bifunctional UDP-N-acetylglucosamine diphosphorylase/glucosamine-1-phosphate N-acetyltransferase GlmU [Gottschalkia acidurici]AFS79381.1 bifunctional UDP-N-acetylglucosamine pyrophosphorylase GlmU [Gottschalkia acidurici 9a]
MILSIILAAGEGTRMKSKLPKVAHKVCGKPLLSHVIDCAKDANIDKNVVVIGYKGDIVKESIDNEDVLFVEQQVGEGLPYGTGYAVMQAKEHIEDDSFVVVLCGDTPLITSETIKAFTKFHIDGGFGATVLTSEISNPTGYGRIIRDNNGNVSGIVEEKDATEEQRKITEVNSGIYCFKGKELKTALEKIDNNNAQKEYYLTDAIHILGNEDFKIGGYKIEDSGEIQGINSKVQLAEAEKIMRKRTNERLMLEGAIIIDPESTYIDKNVKIGIDTVIHPGVVIEGNTEIGEDCIIGQNTRIKNSKIGNKVEIQISNIVDSKVEDDCHIGPFANLRPNSNLGRNVKIGDFVEVKNSTISDNSKASHLSYIGDSEVGKNVNIGCGVVFVNYNGKDKNKTIVKDNTFIGCNSNLISPVIINENSYVAAGSTITNNVEEYSLAIARSRQENKENWVTKKGLIKK